LLPHLILEYLFWQGRDNEAVFVGAAGMCRDDHYEKQDFYFHVSLVYLQILPKNIIYYNPTGLNFCILDFFCVICYRQV
jgi:hypothetical protein